VLLGHVLLESDRFALRSAASWVCLLLEDEADQADGIFSSPVTYCACPKPKDQSAGVFSM